MSFEQRVWQEIGPTEPHLVAVLEHPASTDLLGGIRHAHLR